MPSSTKKTTAIAKLFSLAKNEEEIADLLSDLLTEAEIGKIHERVRIMACLKDGLSQRETQRETGAAIATVTHGALILRKYARIAESIISAAQSMKWWNALFWRV